MAKFNLGINGSDVGAAAERTAWDGELPPTGVYEGVVKVITIGEIGSEAKNAGKPKLSIGIEFRASDSNASAKKYDGYIAWGNLNLIESSLPYVNQFLLALTDGSDAAFDKIKKAFYDSGPTVDERKKHILKIGPWNINSPEGELPIKISISNKPFHNKRTNVTVDQVRIESYLIGAGGAPKGATNTGPVVEDVEEDATVDLEPEEDSEVETEVSDESLLDAD